MQGPANLIDMIEHITDGLVPVSAMLRVCLCVCVHGGGRPLRLGSPAA